MDLYSCAISVLLLRQHAAAGFWEVTWCGSSGVVGLGWGVEGGGRKC